MLPVSLATVGLVGDLPVWVAHPAVVAFLQGVTLLLGMGLSVWLTQKISRQAPRLRLGQHACTIIYGLSLWGLIVG